MELHYNWTHHYWGIPLLWLSHSITGIKNEHSMYRRMGTPKGTHKHLSVISSLLFSNIMRISIHPTSAINSTYTHDRCIWANIQIVICNAMRNNHPILVVINGWLWYKEKKDKIHPGFNTYLHLNWVGTYPWSPHEWNCTWDQLPNLQKSTQNHFDNGRTLKGTHIRGPSSFDWNFHLARETGCEHESAIGSHEWLNQLQF